MITPDDKVPYDDSQDLDPEDQQSQQDRHANGLDENDEPTYADGAADADRLEQASRSSEASYTLSDNDEDED